MAKKIVFGSGLKLGFEKMRNAATEKNKKFWNRNDLTEKDICEKCNLFLELCNTNHYHDWHICIVINPLQTKIVKCCTQPLKVGWLLISAFF